MLTALQVMQFLIYHQLPKLPILKLANFRMKLSFLNPLLLVVIAQLKLPIQHMLY